jgi:hypothetical protein
LKPCCHWSNSISAPLPTPAGTPSVMHPQPSRYGVFVSE